MQPNVFFERRCVRPVLRNGEDSAQPAAVAVAGIAGDKRIVAHHEIDATARTGDLAQIVLQHADARRVELCEIDRGGRLLELFRLGIEADDVRPAAFHSPVNSALFIGVDFPLLAQVTLCARRAYCGRWATVHWSHGLRIAQVRA